MKKILPLFICVLITAISLLITACRHTQAPANRYTSAIQLDRNKGVFISIPANGRHHNREYINSGSLTATALKNALSLYTDVIKITDSCKAKECFPWIATEKYAYYLLPEILHWEEGVAEISANQPDKIAIKLSIYDTSSQKKLASIILKERTHTDNLETFHPQDLLSKPFRQYLKAVYLDKRFQLQ